MRTDVNGPVLVHRSTHVVLVQLRLTDRNGWVDSGLANAAMVGCFTVLFLVTERSYITNGNHAFII